MIKHNLKSQHQHQFRNRENMVEQSHSAPFLVCLVEIERSEMIPQKRIFSRFRSKSA
jgi:hypothetical protein